MEIRRLEKNEHAAAIRLVWETFLEFEAPDYSPEGVESFRAFISDEAELDALVLYGAFDIDPTDSGLPENGLLGVIATKTAGHHISLFFVRRDRHRQGVGRRLFERVLKDCPSESLTVNSSLFAAETYRRLGFGDTDVAQCVNGIRFIPMAFLW